MKYEQIVQIAQSVISSITNTASASIIVLKEFASKSIFKVKVMNPVSKMDIQGKVEVTNLKNIETQLKSNALATRELIKPIKSEKNVKVLNLGDIKFPRFPKFEFPKTIRVTNFPKELKINNLKDLVPALKKMAESIETIDVRPEVKIDAPVVKVEAPVVNVPKQDPPIINVEAPDLSDITKIITFLNKLGVKKPIPVRLSDGKKFYKALEKMAEIYAGSSFSAFQDDGGHNARAILNKNHEVRVTTSATWALNDNHSVGSVNYLGEETVDGKWRVAKATSTGDFVTMRYATIRNNADYTDYSSAWDSHLELEYGTISETL